MAIPLGTNFSLQSEEFNFERDSFKTLAEMKAFPLSSVPDGFSTFCLENRTRYTMNKGGVEDAVTGYWEKDKGVDVDPSSFVLITYDELKTLRDNSELLVGAYYRITDYVATTTQEGTRALDHKFDIVIQAMAANELSENGTCCRHDGDLYFSVADPSSWVIKYSLDNDSSRFAWADEVNGKGVIYNMIDEHNNSVGFDFKNIQYFISQDFFEEKNSMFGSNMTGLFYTYPTSGLWVYVFSYLNYDNVVDDLTVECGSEVWNDFKASGNNSPDITPLGAVVFFMSSAKKSYSDISNNSISKECSDLYFFRYCSDVIVGSNSYNICMIDGCFSTKIGAYCNDITSLGMEGTDISIYTMDIHANQYMDECTINRSGIKINQTDGSVYQCRFFGWGETLVLNLEHAFEGILVNAYYDDWGRPATININSIYYNREIIALNYDTIIERVFDPTLGKYIEIPLGSTEPYVDVKSLSEIGDVSITNPTANQVPTWDPSISKWTNKDLQQTPQFVEEYTTLKFEDLANQGEALGYSGSVGSELIPSIMSGIPVAAWDKIPIKAGDTLLIANQMGPHKAVWTITDENNIILEEALSGTNTLTTQFPITVLQDGFLYISLYQNPGQECFVKYNRKKMYGELMYSEGSIKLPSSKVLVEGVTTQGGIHGGMEQVPVYNCVVTDFDCSKFSKLFITVTNTYDSNGYYRLLLYDESNQLINNYNFTQDGDYEIEVSCARAKYSSNLVDYKIYGLSLSNISDDRVLFTSDIPNLKEEFQDSSNPMIWNEITQAQVSSTINKELSGVTYLFQPVFDNGTYFYFGGTSTYAASCCKLGDPTQSGISGIIPSIYGDNGGDVSIHTLYRNLNNSPISFSTSTPLTIEGENSVVGMSIDFTSGKIYIFNGASVQEINSTITTGNITVQSLYSQLYNNREDHKQKSILISEQIATTVDQFNSLYTIQDEIIFPASPCLHYMSPYTFDSDGNYKSSSEIKATCDVETIVSKKDVYTKQDILSNFSTKTKKIETSESTLILKPNTLYVLPTVVSLDLELQPASDGELEIYHIVFKTGSVAPDVWLPEGIKIEGTVEATSYVEMSIMENRAIVKSYSL